METISSFLTNDHRACDAEFAELENSVVAQNWEAANVFFEKFKADMINHFEMEEKVMFLEFEQKTGMTQGPTKVMTMEHNQMRQVLNSMSEDIKKQDKDHFIGLSESLMMLMQQHNMKEEQMLYAMADAHIGDKAEEIIENMKAI